VNDEIEGSDVICGQKQWKTTQISLEVCQPAPSEQRKAGKYCQRNPGESEHYENKFFSYERVVEEWPPNSNKPFDADKKNGEI